MAGASRAAQILYRLIAIKKEERHGGDHQISPDDLDEAIDAVYRLTELER